MNEAAGSDQRIYRKKLRAQQEEETRQRIVDAAIELHATEGFPGASVSAIADRAGVGRVTVYRHFPDYDAILGACTAHYMALNPPPRIEQWAGIDDPDELVCAVVSDTYDYFQANEPMFTHGAADAVTLPFLAQRMQEIGGYWAVVRDWLIGRLCPEWEPDPGAAALVGLLLSFSGWQSLVRQQQLSFEETKMLAVRTIDMVLTEESA